MKHWCDHLEPWCCGCKHAEAVERYRGNRHIQPHLILDAKAVDSALNDEGGLAQSLQGVVRGDGLRV